MVRMKKIAVRVIVGWLFLLTVVPAAGLLLPGAAMAQEGAPAAAEAAPAAEAPAAEAPAGVSADDLAALKAQVDAQKVGADTVWTMIAAFLVFWMNAGFALVESGFCRAKNATNILGKNFVVFGCATLAFWILGFSMMFGEGGSWIGNFHLFFQNDAAMYPGLSWTNVPVEAKFFFQLVFAGTAATIVSGCVAERIKYLSFIVFAFLLTILVYPVVGHWIWGGGWLGSGGFWDFAGSTVVHTVGGAAGLAGILLLGPRHGKYHANGTMTPVLGHSMSLATLGTLILWLGWFGFNPGSTMALDGNAIAHIAMTTNMAAVAGILSATGVAWIVLGKPDLSMTLNGCLAGLVAITAPCAWVTVGGAFWIGLISGAIAVGAVIFFDRMKLDDPVGALAVHLVNGTFGTLAVGLFAAAPYANAEGNAAPKLGLFYGGGMDQLLIQLKGSVSAIAYTFVVSLVLWFIIKVTIGIRVDIEDEVQGLDISEMGLEAYNGDTLAGTPFKA